MTRTNNGKTTALVFPQRENQRIVPDHKTGNKIRCINDAACKAGKCLLKTHVFCGILITLHVDHWNWSGI